MILFKHTIEKNYYQNTEKTNKRKNMLCIKEIGTTKNTIVPILSIFKIYYVGSSHSSSST